MSQYAENHPNRYVVGVEVRKQMVEAFKTRYTIPNCLPLWGAGAICLEDVIPDGNVSRVFIFHPDPWFKKRHHKRRVVNHHLFTLIKQKLVPGGIVYISTDVQELYEDMMNLCETYGNLEFIKDDPFWGSDYLTHWSMFSDLDDRSQFFIAFKFKEEKMIKVSSTVNDKDPIVAFVNKKTTQKMVQSELSADYAELYQSFKKAKKFKEDTPFVIRIGLTPKDPVMVVIELGSDKVSTFRSVAGNVVRLLADESKVQWVSVASISNWELHLAQVIPMSSYKVPNQKSDQKKTQATHTVISKNKSFIQEVRLLATL